MEWQKQKWDITDQRRVYILKIFKEAGVNGIIIIRYDSQNYTAKYLCTIQKLLYTRAGITITHIYNVHVN